MGVFKVTSSAIVFSVVKLFWFYDVMAELVIEPHSPLLHIVPFKMGPPLSNNVNKKKQT